MLPLLALMPLPQPATETIRNGDFGRGLEGWTVRGAATVDEGKLRLGRGKGSVEQRYEVPGLRILYFGATIRANGPATSGRIRLRCFDGRKRLVMDLDGKPDPKTDQAGIYLKTQARTAYVVVSIEKTASVGTLIVDDAILKDDDRDRVEHRPEVHLGEYLRPIWQGGRVTDESVLLDPDEGGRLLFPPSGPLVVRDATLGTTFEAGKDYTVEGRTIRPVKGSAIPSMGAGEFKTGEFPWTETAGRQVMVSYSTNETWSGPLPVPQAARLPQTTRRLEARDPLTVVAFGDSITLGNNVSGYRNVPPYLPPWPELVGYGLRERYGNPNVKVINTALGGMTSQWAVDNARDAVASLDPDLVILAFGMNDFWSLTPGLFAANIRKAMDTIRARQPKVEFLLVAPMKFDPAYTADPTYVGNLAGYAGELRKLSGSGTAFLDMTAITDWLYREKGAKSLITDPMHPNDFLARVYAQAVLATVSRP